jgi:hypothetical protein
MAIDKGLYEAPVGLGALPEPDLVIEVEDPESMTIGMDGALIELMKEEPRAEQFDANLAEFISEGDLQSLASELIGHCEQDLSSRKDWLDTYIKGLKILGIRY